MPNITNEINDIEHAVYGRDVRGSIRNAIVAINSAVDASFSSGNGAPSTVIGNPAYSGLLYLDESNYNLYRSRVSGNSVIWGSAIANLEGVSISSIAKASTSGLVDTYQINYTKGKAATQFTVNNGNGISNIALHSTTGLVDTYRITYTDGTHKDFTVANGRGIDDVTGPVLQSDKLTNRYKFEFNDNTETEFDIKDGRGITNVSLLSTSGLVDTYRIMYNDDTYKDFDVTNGRDGVVWYRGSVISGKNVNPTVFVGSDVDYAVAGDFYLNFVEGSVYHCYSGGDPATASWAYDFDMAGGGSTGVRFFKDLLDVRINSLKDGQTIRSRNGIWENVDSGGVAKSGIDKLVRKVDFEINNDMWAKGRIDGQDVWSDGTNTYFLYAKIDTLNNKMTKFLTQDLEGRYIWTDGTDIYYSHGTTQKKFNRSTREWSNMSWTGMTNFDGTHIWTDGTDIYYSNYTTTTLDPTMKKLNGTTWEEVSAPGTMPHLMGEYVWADGTDIYYSFTYGSYNYQKKLNRSNNTWEDIVWSGMTSFNGIYIWTDGTDIYYSYDTTQKKLNRSNNTWEDITWTGMTSFYGMYIWTDGVDTYCSFGSLGSFDDTFPTYKLVDNNTWEKLYIISNCHLAMPLLWSNWQTIWTDGIDIYYSWGENQKKWNRDINTWQETSWFGMGDVYEFMAYYIWTDGTDIYFSDGSIQKKLNRSNNTWEDIVWSGMTSFQGTDIWTDGVNIYFSSGSTQKKLNRSNNTWENMTWTGMTSFNGENIWTDGTDIYYSYETTQKKLNGTTWEDMTWSGMTSFYPLYIWTDGTDIYYSYDTTQKKLNRSNNTWEDVTWTNKPKYGSMCWTDGINIYMDGESAFTHDQHLILKAYHVQTAKSGGTFGLLP